MDKKEIFIHKSIQKASNYTQNNMPQKAETLYSEVLKKYPNNFLILLNFGIFYFQYKQMNKAKELLEKAKAIHTDQEFPALADLTAETSLFHNPNRKNANL